MDFQKLLQDKRILIGLITVVAVLVLGTLIFIFMHAGNGERDFKVFF